jgi:hypothetical protein
VQAVAILIAATKGGLQAVANASGGLEIIEGTVQPFDGLETFSDPPLTSAGVIGTNKRGWIALAIYPG